MFFCYFVIVSRSSQKAETLHLNKLESPSPKNTLCHVWLKLAQWFWRIRSLNFVNVFSLFCNLCRIISHWERERPFIWTNLNPQHQRMLNAKFGCNWPSCYGEEDFFKILSMYLCFFVIISPWKRPRPFIWTNLNSLHARMICAKFGWNLSSGSGEVDFQIFRCISKLRNYLPLEKGGTLHLIKIESQRMLCAKFCWNWLSGFGEDLKNLSMYFLYFVIISPWKRGEPFIWINLNPLHARMLCAKFGWNWPSGSGEEDENKKS